MVNFHGWMMPLQYGKIIAECKKVRDSAGLFDLSHMGEIEISGKDFFAFTQKVFSNDIFLIKPGRMQYGVFCNECGGVIDDLMLYRFKDKVLCVVNASNTEKDFCHLKKNRAGFDIKIENKSERISLIALQGPSSEKILQGLTVFNLSSLKYLEFVEIGLSNKKCLISRSGYSGEDGFEIYTQNKDCLQIWKDILEKGKDEILPCGLGARDILRLEMGYPLYGQEIDENTSPLEANLRWAIKLNKDFIGREAIQKRGIEKKLVGLEMLDKGVGRKGYKIRLNGEIIGEVSSGNFSPALNKFIALGYLKKKDFDLGEEVSIEVRSNLLKAKIVQLPFIKRKK